MHKLRELVVAALAASRGRGTDVSVWEGHLIDGFNAFVGGKDIFQTEGGIDGSCYLLTVVEHDCVIIHAYGGNMAPAAPYEPMSRYPVIGYGVFMRCVLGECGEVRATIERDYCSLGEGMKEGDFYETYGKKFPYRAAHDESLIDFSRGVVDVLEGAGTEEDPLIIFVNNDRRLKAGSYHDLRRFDTIADLINGIYGVWSTLISENEGDWEKIIGTLQPAFIERMEGDMPF